VPTRRSSRLRTAASEAPAAGTTESVFAVESVLAIASVAPLSRRAARQRSTADEAPTDAPLADAPLAEAPLATDKVEELIEVVEPADARAEQTAPTADFPEAEADAFERASRAFRNTGPVPTASASPECEADATTGDAGRGAGTPSHVAAPRARRIRKFVTVGATVGVMSLAGLLAVSMTLPAEAVAAVQGQSVAATSLVSASGSAVDGEAKEEIQAFVAPSDVENGSLARADQFSTMSLVQVAAEQGINYSGEVFTNDPDAAIQWPFMVGVGMSYGYGMRSGRLHEGIDFVPGNGAPVQAIADGTVRIATEQGGAYGVTVYIDHVIDGSVITSHYSHMQYGSLQVKQGQTVKVGDIVGKTGNTGRSYGAHMHFELIVNGSTIDPLPWLRANAGRSSY
jgi:murein DD-endopeptidase MepM/ murein hydrolase activator NlpD